MESLHLCGIFLLLILFCQYPPLMLSLLKLIWKKILKIPKGQSDSYIEKEQTTQCPTEKVQKDKQRPTKYTYKTKDRKLNLITHLREYIVRIQMSFSLLELVFVSVLELKIDSWLDDECNIISDRTCNVFVKYSMEKELPTLPRHLSVAHFGALVWHVRWLSAMCFINNCLSVLIFLLTIVLSIVYLFTVFYYAFGIFKLFNVV